METIQEAIDKFEFVYQPKGYSKKERTDFKSELLHLLSLVAEEAFNSGRCIENENNTYPVDFKTYIKQFTDDLKEI